MNTACAVRHHFILGGLQKIGKWASIWTVAWVALVSPTLVQSSEGYPTNTFDIPEGAYSAEHLEDVNHISVMRFSGNYDRDLEGGVFNRAARATVAREFYKNHPDNYDFIVTFTSFEIETGEAVAFYHGVRNDVKGIGRPLFDNSAIYGSDSKLQGMIDMAATSRYNLNSFSAEYDWPLSVLAHEVLHRWGSFVRYRDAAGNLRDDLLGRNAAHWNFFLDTNASVQYGHRWRKNGDGSFAATAARQFYSPLDLYLMGFYRAEEVPDFMLIEPGGANTNVATDIPFKGAVAYGSPKYISVNDIIAAEGPRVPSASDSQKEFRFAFVYLIGDSQEADPVMLAKLSELRRAFMERFSILTGGRAIGHAYPEALPVAELGEQNEINAGENDAIRIENADVTDAFTWLKDRQNTVGYWEDLEKTRLRDTTTAYAVLRELDANFLDAQSVEQWLTSQSLDNTDSLARVLRVMPGRDTALSEDLRKRQNMDGGWGLERGLLSSVLDTALAVEALATTSVSQTSTVRGVEYLLSQQKADGSWSHTLGGNSGISTTAAVVQALLVASPQSPKIDVALRWLATQQHPDGGFGAPQSSIHETAEVINAIVQSRRDLPEFNAVAAASFINQQQRESGTWEGSVYTTALAAKSLRLLSNGNLALSDFRALSLGKRDGERVRLSVRVANDSPLSTLPASVNVYMGHPQKGGTAIASALRVPDLSPGNEVEFSFVWDTFDKAGEHRLYAWIEPNPAQFERTLTDNLQSLDYTVDAAPDLVDFELNDIDVLISPDNPSVLPTQLAISAVVRNVGKANATQALVSVWRNAVGEGGELLDAQRVDILGRSSVAVNFVADFISAGASEFIVVADADDAIAEASETNNTASKIIVAADSLDLEARDLGYSPEPGALYEDVLLHATIKNNGTRVSPNTSVVFSVINSAGTQEILSTTVALEAGESRVVTAPWRADLAGESTFRVNIDRDNLVAEAREDNNNVSIPVTVQQIMGANLSVRAADLSFNPSPAKEGLGLAIRATIHNIGSESASAVPVGFYEGDPAAGGRKIGDTVIIASLASGASITLEHILPQVVGTADRFIFVVIDPEGRLSETKLTDNTAFEKIEVQSLADLAVSEGAIELAPRFPNLGDTVSVTVNVVNKGVQGADNVLVRAYRGMPDQGGVEIGSGYSIASIAGGSSGSVQFQMEFPELGRQEIYVEVDPAGDILEADRSNNRALKTIAIQDGSFYVSEPYFSPNGDQVKDSSSYFFRLDTQTVNTVVVLDQADREVRHFDLSSTVSGSVTWDGRSDFGSIVNDGVYLFALKNNNGSYSGTTRVVVDTNRLGLADALDTRYQLQRNLSCNLGDLVSLDEHTRSYYSQRSYVFRPGLMVFSRDDQTVYFSVKPRYERIDGELVDVSPLPPGLYKAEKDGSNPVLINDFSDVDPATPLYHGDILQLLVNDDETKLVIVSGGARAHIHQIDLKNSTAVQFVGRLDDRDFKFKRAAFIPGSSQLVTVKADWRKSVEWLVESWSLDDENPSPRLLTTLTYDSPDFDHLRYTVELHPNVDGSRLAVFTFPYERVDHNFASYFASEQYYLDVINPRSGESFSIAGRPTAFAWSPEGKRIAVGDATLGRISVLSSDGASIRHYPFSKQYTLDPETDFIRSALPAAYRGDQALLGKYVGISWNPDGTEFSFIFESYARAFILDQIIVAAPGGDGYGYGEADAEDFDLSQFDIQSHHGVYLSQVRSGELTKIAELEPIGNSEQDYWGYIENLDLESLPKNEFDTPIADSGLPILPWSNNSSVKNNQSTQQKNFVWMRGSRAVLVGMRARHPNFNTYSHSYLIGMDSHIPTRQILRDEFISTESPPFPTATGRNMLFASLDGKYACPGLTSNFEFMQISSLLNQVVDLRPTVSAKSGGILLYGTATDKNSGSIFLEYASIHTPDNWRAIAPKTSQSFIDEQITTWVPPDEGSYYVRMTSEDLAGNIRRVIKRASISEQPSITQLYRSPSHFSPNGDGARDVVNIYFRVLEPVNLAIEILNEDGIVVRSMNNSYTNIGADEVVSWDGRDDNGVRVADGSYTLRVQNYELLVDIDTAFPTIVDTTKNWLVEIDRGDGAYPFYGVDSFIHLVASDERSVPDALVQYRPLNSAAWLDSPNDVIEYLGGQRYDHAHLIQEWLQGEFRMVATDAASNTTVHNLDRNLKLDQFAITAVGVSTGSAGGDEIDFHKPQAVELSPAEYENGLYSSEQVYPIQSNGILTLDIYESITSEIRSVKLVYFKDSNDDQKFEALPDSFGSHRSCVEFGGRGKCYITSELKGGVVPNSYFSLAFDLGKLNYQQDTSYRAYVELIDNEGIAHSTNSFLFFQGIGIKIFNGLDFTQNVPEAMVAISPLSQQDFSHVELFVSSKDDEALLQEALLGRLDPNNERDVESITYLGDGSTFLRFNAEKLRACTNYEAKVVLYLNDGRKYYSSGTIEAPCVSVEKNVRPLFPEQCDLPAKEKIQIEFRVLPTEPRGAPEGYIPPALKEITIYRELEDGAVVDTLFNLNDPEYNDDLKRDFHAVILDAGAYEEGDLPLFLKVVDVNDNEVVHALSVPIVHSPPALDITFPIAGQKYCANEYLIVIDGEEEKISGIEIQGTSSSRGPHSFEILSDEKRVDCESTYFDELLWANFPVPIDGPSSPLCKPEHLKSPDSVPVARAKLINNPFIFESKVKGTLGIAILNSGTGNYSLGINQYNWSGAKACHSVEIEVDTEVSELEIGLNKDAGIVFGAVRSVPVFSPNGDGLYDRIAFNYGVGELVTVGMDVYAVEFQGFDRNANPVFSQGAHAESVLQNFSAAAGTREFVWEASGQADGFYRIEFSTTDACGFNVISQFYVELDTTPPALTLSYPTAQDVVGVLVEPRGKAFDKQSTVYNLSFTKEGDQFSAIANGHFDSAEEQVLGAWNTFGLEGTWQLRLQAVDTVGNASIATLNVDMPQRSGLISAFSSSSKYLSPNADAVLDTLSVYVSFEMPAQATITAVQNGVVRAVLADQALFDVGQSSVTWNGYGLDGKPLPDGEYQLRVSAKAQSDVSIVQEEFLTLIVDATPPQIVVDDAQASLWSINDLSKVQVLRGHITDANFVDYSVAVTSTPLGLHHTTLTNSTVLPTVNLAIIDPSILTEQGAYRLQITASDAAGNVAQNALDVYVDTVPPELTVTTPAAPAVVKSSDGVFAIRGSIVEERLNYYALSLLTNTGDTVYREQMDRLPVDDLLLNLDLTAIAEGAYELLVEAEDLGGLRDSYRVAFAVDNTPPELAFNAFNNEPYVTGPMAFLGRATDAHFKQFELALADGHPATGSFAPIAINNKAVNSGLLLDWQTLPADGQYTLRLSAVDKADNASAIVREIIVDTTPPPAPIIDSIEYERVSETIALRWQTVSVPDLRGYFVYRNGIRLNSEPLSVLLFNDATLPEGEYVYSVSAIDLAGLESERADITITVDKTPPLTKLIKPASGKTVSGLVDIIGTASSYGDFKEYRLFVSASGAQAETELTISSVAIENDVLGQLNTQTLLDGETYTLRLLAEDIHQNRAEARLDFIVDNAAPSAPENLRAVLVGNDIQSTWDASTSNDVVGYLLFRNDAIANAVGRVIGDLSPYLIGDTRYLDLGIVDGTHNYVVVAMDAAGNLSPPSTPAEVLVDRRAPHAVLAGITSGDEFEHGLFLNAQVEDLDVAEVRFEYRISGTGDWQLIKTDTAAPYHHQWDTSALDYGDYDLRALASDTRGNVDPNPDVLNLHKLDLTRPEMPLNLRLKVQGGEISLSWTASTSTDVVGYELQRSSADNIDWQPLPVLNDMNLVNATNYVDADVADGRYVYRVLAADGAGNTSEPSDDVAAIVFTPGVVIPFSPTLSDSLLLTGTTLSFAYVAAEITFGTETREIDTVADAEGKYTLSDPALALGRSSYVVTAMNGDGFVSKSVSGSLLRAGRPSQVLGAKAVLSTDQAAINVSWDANPETNIVGYRVYRDDVSVSARGESPYSAQSSEPENPSYPLALLNDGSHYTYWASDKRPDYLTLDLDAPVWVDQVDLVWYNFNYLSTDFEIQAWDGEGYFTVVHAQYDHYEAQQNYVFDAPYYTDRLRLKFNNSRYDFSLRPLRLSELRISHLALSNTSDFFAEAPDDGFHQYQVTAVNDSGFEGAKSALTEVLGYGDVAAPDPVVLSAVAKLSDVELSWQPSIAPDATSYRLYRDATLIADIDVGDGTGYVDKDLLNGSYVYVIHVVDEVGNVSAPSNSVGVTVAKPLLTSPVNLSADVDAATGTIYLSWQPGPGEPPHAYVLQRKVAGTLDYTALYRGAALGHHDSDVVLGTRYNYVVIAQDALGNTSVPSNEVSATAEDSVAPDAPRIFFPAPYGDSFSTEAPSVDVLGYAEPGATVYLAKNGVVTGSKTLPSITRVSQIDGANVQQTAVSGSGDVAAIMRSNDTYEYGIYLFDGERWRLLGDRRSLGFYLSGLSWYQGEIAVFGNAGQVVLLDPNNGARRELSGWYSQYGYMQGKPVFNAQRGSVIFVGDVNFEYGIFEYNFDTETTTPYASICCYSNFSLSPDGRLGAFVTNNSSTARRLTLLDFSTDSVTQIDIAGGSTQNWVTNPAWSADGQRLLIPLRGVSGFDELHSYNLQTQEQVLLASVPGRHIDNALWARDEPSLLYTATNGQSVQVLRQDIATGERVVVYEHQSDAYPRLSFLTASPLNSLVFEQSGTGLVAVREPGAFVFRSEALREGVNTFSATARDLANNSSLDSESITATRTLPDLPDLAVTLSNNPLIPHVGEGVNVLVQLVNLGPVAAPSTRLRLIARQGSTLTTLADAVQIPALESGASIGLPLPWVPALEGSYDLVAQVDAANAVVESEKANNTVAVAVDVVAEARPLLGLSLDNTQPLRANTVLAGTWTLTNAASVLNGELQLTIYDAQGYVVQELMRRELFNVPHGETLKASFNWNSGSTFAGSYRVQLMFTDVDGDDYVASRSFDIVPDVRLTSGVITNLPSYSANEEVRILGTVVNNGGNAVFAGGSAEIHIVDATGSPVFSETRAIGQLLPGAKSEIASAWNTATEQPGDYWVRLNIVPSADAVSPLLSTAQFAIRQSEPQILGRFTESELEIGNGQNLSVAYTLSNQGNANLQDVQLGLVLIDKESGAELSVIDTQMNLAKAATLTLTAALETAARAIGRYELQLRYSAVVLGNAYAATLDKAQVRIVDATAPELTLVRPESGAIINSNRELGSALAIDTHSAVDSVYYRLDGGIELKASAAIADRARYSVPLAGLNDGAHRLALTAVDTLGNQSNTQSVDFVVDNTAPLIEVNGLVDGEFYLEPLVPQIAVQDAHLDTVVITLNGEAYTSATPITADGEYRLLISATDKADNIADALYIFGLDTTAATITVDGVADQGVYAAPVIPIVTISDTNLASSSMTLNGEVFSSGTEIVHEGTYQLAVRAQDAVGHISELVLNFELDFAAPGTPHVIDPANGATLSSSPVSITGSAEAHAMVFARHEGGEIYSTSADAEGRFVFENVELAAGANRFTLSATDKAGNTSDDLAYALQLSTGPDIVIESGLGSTARVLIWAPERHPHYHPQCPGRGQHSGHLDSYAYYGSDVEAYVEALENTYTQAGIDYYTARSADDFVVALRTQKYSVVQLINLHEQHASPLFLWSRAAIELRAAVLSGSGLIVTNTKEYGLRSLAELTGVHLKGRIGQGATIDFSNTVVSEGLNWESQSRELLKLDVFRGTPLGRIRTACASKRYRNCEYPAAAVSDYGHGKTITLPFNALESADAGVFSELMLTLTSLATPTARAPLPSELFALDWVLSELPQGASLVAVQSANDHLQIGEVLNGGRVENDSVLRWDIDAAPEHLSLSAMLYTQDWTGSQALALEVYRSYVAPANLLAEKTLEISVAQSLAALESQARNAVEAIPSAGRYKQRRRYALHLLNQAIALPKANRTSIDKAIFLLSVALEDLRFCGSDEAQLRTAELIRVYQSLWTVDKH